MGDRVLVTLDILKADLERFARADNLAVSDYHTSDIVKHEIRLYFDDCEYGNLGIEEAIRALGIPYSKYVDAFLELDAFEEHFLPYGDNGVLFRKFETSTAGTVAAKDALALLQNNEYEELEALLKAEVDYVTIPELESQLPHRHISPPITGHYLPLR